MTTGSDHLERLEFRIPQTVLVTLALEAHRRNITLNDYIVSIALEEAKRVIEEHQPSNPKIVDLEAANG